MKSFKTYLKDGKGEEYEARIQTGLYNAGYAVTNKTAGSSNRADGVFLHKKKEHNLEIGTTGKDFAQGKVRWRNGKWFAETKNSKTLTKFLQTLTYDDDLMDQWGPVAIGTDVESTAKDRVKAARSGGDLYLTDVPPNMIWDYYGDKGVYYIQVDGYGAFYMKRNPAKLPIPKFSVIPEIRFRVKGYGSKSSIPHDTTWAVKIPTGGMVNSAFTFDVKDTTRIGPAEFLK